MFENMMSLMLKSLNSNIIMSSLKLTQEGELLFNALDS